MNYDLPRALRLSAGRALLSVSRALARHGACLIGHPSAQAARTPLRVVPSDDRVIGHCLRGEDSPDVEALLRRIGGAR